MIDKNSARRDAALMAGIALGSFVHLTFANGSVEQGWLHLHEGRLHCCTQEQRTQCDDHRMQVARYLNDGKLREYPPMDVENLIRVDASIVRSGHYVAIWHHSEYAEKHHVLTREDLVCCELDDS